ncbi:MAG TPA: hypothetical protein VL461_10835 [Dictyobacter sp.]|jgi:hypothetical protein|nr:hypothetical protein [Dictyobacter sp.]
MSEFERQNSDDDDNVETHARFSLTGDTLFPVDFSAEDVVFALELDEMFSAVQEEVPPFFVQTLLEAEDPQFQEVERGFELKTRAQVFRRLRLKHRLFPKPRLSLRTQSRSLLAFMTSFFVVFLVTVLLTAPSFAAGIQYLWAGSHAGVFLVQKYPAMSTPTPTPATATQPKLIRLMDAQRLLHFPLYFSLSVPARYKLSNIYMYQNNQGWSDGPIIVENYTYALPGEAPRHIAICEFKPLGQVNVMQVVQNGAAQQIQISSGESSYAIYVRGQWAQREGATPAWAYNDRSEFIYEAPGGIVFWVVGDKSDGINENVLSSIVKSIYTLDNSHANTILENLLIQDSNDTPDMFENTVLYVQDPNNLSGSSFLLVGRVSEVQNNHVH